MTIVDSEYFRELPAFKLDMVAGLKVHDELSLLILEHIDIGKSVIFPVQYKHRELIYRSPVHKDAVALGVAKLEGSESFQDVRILFSQYHATATMRGLALEGQVKLGGVAKNA